MGFQTTKEGEFWRILLPGIYSMEVFAEGFQPREVQFAVIEQNPTLLNITLLQDSTRRSDQVFLKQSNEASIKTEKDDVVKPVEKEEESEGLFSFTNPFSSIQKSVEDILGKIPLIG